MVSSDFGKLDAKRHFTSGIDCAIAGAARVVLAATAPPTPAVRRNLRRCMNSSPNKPKGAGLWQVALWLNSIEKPRAAGLFAGLVRARLELVGGRLAGHEVVVGVLRHA